MAAVNYPYALFIISLYLLRKRKERGSEKAEVDALESLEAKLRDKAESLGLPLEQKTKGMKQRDKKVKCTVQKGPSFYLCILPQ